MGKTWQDWLAQRFKFDREKTLSQKDVLIFIYKHGYLYLVLILITFVAGINYANNLILGFCFLISAVLCMSFYLTFKQLHALKIEIHADEVGQVGEQLQFNLYFEQAAIQPRYLYIQADQQIYKLYFTEYKKQFSIPIEAVQRGQLNYPVIRIYSIYPFGLIRAWSYFYHHKTAWIAPKSVFYTAENKQHQQSFKLEMDEFRELRNYQMGDSLHAVSWKQAARGQGLYIKVFEQFQEQQHIEIHYDHMPSQSHEEKLELMMGLVEQCEQQQCAYSVHLPQAELAQDRGNLQLSQVKRLLAQA
ncbi:MAG: DUF58 domain-containing protein [Candidatus Acinetobacter avistercoris]|uniref:DUF58 domain-containing protein n=1 Tax=Acinetobacter sp. KS-LM10 TaxID=3120518 RepID=UPI001F95EFAA|nr:DUF58 domain-containing protein [Candidatus Acinetobacter avistercoris]